MQVPNQDIGGADGDPGTPAVMTYGDIATYSTQFLDGWSPLVRSINIHDNTIAGGTYAPKGSLIRDIIFGYTINGNKVPDILYDGIGELMAQIPENGGGLFDLADGIDQVAQALDGNGLESAGARIPDLAEFGGYQATDFVCAADNGDINQAAVFATNPAEADFENGEP